MHAFSGSNRWADLPSRAGSLRVVVGASFLLLALRLVLLQVVEHERYAELARGNRLREEVLPAIRGVIRDKNGVRLADSVPAFALGIDPYHPAFTADPAVLDTTLARLGQLLGVPAEPLRERVDSQKGQSYQLIRLARHLDFATVSRIEERRDRFPGVEVEVEPARRYPAGALTAHLIGYVGEVRADEIGVAAGGRTYAPGDRVGRGGIEARFEAELGGANGRRMVEVNAMGRRADRFQPRRQYQSVELPTHGDDLVLTIDAHAQHVAAQVFPDSAAGAVVAMDVRDGGVLVLLSRPSFDPNEFVRGLTPERWHTLNSDARHPLHHRALKSGYPPGSTFKVVTGVAAVSEGVVSLTEMPEVKCEGGMQYGNRFFGCHAVHGHTAFREALTMSCDVYFYQMGNRLGLASLADYARAAGFGRSTGIELPEAPGLVPDAAWYDRRYGKRRWTRGHVLNLSIGQGEILATPLQLAALMAQVARDWQPIVPYLVAEVGGRARQPLPAAHGTTVDPLIQRAIVEGLESVVAAGHGTGRAAQLSGIRVAGKTGTAENPHGEDHALFAAFAPVEAPRVAVAVVVEHGGHGGAVAAPVAAEVLAACLGMAPVDSTRVAEPQWAD